MRLLIQKFGGTSVQTKENRVHVIQQIKRALAKDYKLVVVVSALGRNPDPYATDTLLKMVDHPTTNNSKRELDMLMSCGETIASVGAGALLKPFSMRNSWLIRVANSVTDFSATPAEKGLAHVVVTPLRVRVTLMTPDRLEYTVISTKQPCLAWLSFIRSRTATALKKSSRTWSLTITRPVLVENELPNLVNGNQQVVERPEVARPGFFLAVAEVIDCAAAVVVDEPESVPASELLAEPGELVQRLVGDLDDLVGDQRVDVGVLNHFRLSSGR